MSQRVLQHARSVSVAMAMLAVSPLVTAAADDAPPAAATTPPAREPTLDELLGLAKPDAAQDAKPEQPQAVDPTQTQLDRDLRSAPISDQFLSAVGLMRESADRLGKAKDAGLQTQRVQDEILKKLDKLIDDAKQQSQQQQQQQSQSQQEQQQQQQQQQQSSQSQQQQQQQQSGANAQGGNVPKRDGQRRQQSAGNMAEWGNLPARVRDALVQGSGDSFSATYERLTEEYYKRLAQQAQPAPATNENGGQQ